MLEWVVMKKLRHSSDFWAVLTLVAVWFLFFWRIWTPVENDRLSFAEGDFSGQFVAWTDYAVERLEAGEIPQWNPYAYAGAPFQADSQTALTYPPRMVTLATLLLQKEVTPAEVYSALQFEVMLHVLLASLFVYAFVRRLLTPPLIFIKNESTPFSPRGGRVGDGGAIWGGLVAGVTYAYGGYVAGYPILQVPLLEAGIWLPLILLGILEATHPHSHLQGMGGLRTSLEPAPTRRRVVWRWLTFAAVFLGFCLLAGHPQTALFTIYLAVAWLGYRLYPDWRAWLVSVVFLGVVSGALAAVQLIPTAEFSLHTSRVEMTFEAKGGGYSFAELSNLLFPIRGEIWNPNYLGIVPLILIGVAVWRKVQFWGFFTLAFGIAFFLSFGQKTALYGLLYPVLPGMALFRGQERAMFMMAHCAAVLTGLGLAQAMTWGTREIHHRKPIRQALIIFALLCVLVAGVFFVIGLTEANNRAVEDRLASAAFSALLFGAMLFGLHWFLQAPTHPIQLAALLGLLVFDLFSATAMLKQNYQPIPVEERVSFPAHLADLNLPAGARIDGRGVILDGYSTLYRVPDINGSDPLQLAPIRTYLEEIPLNRQHEILAVGAFGEGWQAVDNPRPFAHLVYGYYRVATDDEAYGFLREPAFDVQNLAILETQVNGLPDVLPETPPGKVEMIRFAPEKIVMQVDTGGDTALLTLALPDYPGWHAEIDGDPVEIVRNYGGLSAVVVPPGTHTVTLEFRSRWLLLSGVISGVAWLMILFTLVWIGIRREPVTIEGVQGVKS